MAYTDTDLTAIRTAIAKGERTVQFADRAVTYRSMDELLKAEARISRALAASSARPKRTLLVASRGL